MLQGPTPYVATVSNRGPDAQGRIVANLADAGTVVYPVNLPRGSTKQITVIVSAQAQYSGIEIVLDTDRGRVARTVRPEYGYSSEGNALLIGGSSGDLAFLNPSPALYVPADTAPDRPILYSAFDFVVLSETAERMSDSAVRALQTWLVAGGTVALLGGASSPLLHDPRWAPFLPMAPTGARDVMVSRSVEQIWGRRMPNEPISVTVGRVAASGQVRASGPIPLVIERCAGGGRVVQFAFNPFDEPLRTWQGLNKLFARHLPPRRNTIKSLGSGNGDAGTFMPTWLAPPPVPGSPSISAARAYTPPQDAFNLELPPWDRVLTLLIVYAVLVVPVNLLVLRRLRKSEWAWVTAPMLSLGFAAAFFSFAGTLYKTPLSTAVTGTLMWDTRLPQGYFIGQAQMFVPRGGRYDLGLEGADFVVGSGSYDEYGMRGSQRVSLDLVDTGTLNAPEARFANLTYHSLSLGQIVPTGSWLRATADTQADIKITNTSPHRWQTLALIGPNASQTMPALAPGDTWTVPKAMRMRDIRKPTQPPLVLWGTLEGFRPGPQLGSDASQPQAVHFIVVIDLETLRP